MAIEINNYNLINQARAALGNVGTTQVGGSLARTGAVSLEQSGVVPASQNAQLDAGTASGSSFGEILNAEMSTPETYEAGAATEMNAPKTYEAGAATEMNAPKTYEAGAATEMNAPKTYEAGAATEMNAPKTYEAGAATEMNAPKTYEAGAATEMNAPKTYDLDAIFEKAADTYKVPVSLLKAMAKAESGFNPNAISSCGAQGIMQLMPATQKALGVTDAFDPEQNIMGGAKYISDKINQYGGNITLALAAYQAGSGNVAKYGGVPPFASTRTYINNIMNYMSSDLTAGSVAISNTPSVGRISGSEVSNTRRTNGANTGFSNGLGAGLSNGLGAGLNNGLVGDEQSNGLGAGLSNGLGAGLSNGLSTFDLEKLNAALQQFINELYSGSTGATGLSTLYFEQLISGQGTNDTDSLADIIAQSPELQAFYGDAASSGVLSQWLALGNLNEDEDFGGFSDLVRSYNNYNMLRVNAGIADDDPL